MSDKIRLEILTGPWKGKIFSFTGPTAFVIGRAEDAHCRLAEDPFVSRHHLVIEIAAPLARARDLGSINGFLLNGTRIGGLKPEGAPPEGVAEAGLKDGDELQVGETGIRIRFEGATRTDGPSHRFEAPVLPGYEILRQLGAGHLGRVYLARRERDGRRFAIKAVQPRRAAAGDAMHRLEREIRLLRELRHENIVAYEEHGLSGAELCLVMEYADGGSLQDRLAAAGGRLAPEEALPILRDAARGLAAAHERGIVHRDLKPGNILLSGAPPARRAKIADLGLAKSFRTAGVSGLTLLGDVGGSYGYMPREQVLNFRNVTPAADVFALAATLYVALSGRMIYDLKGATSALALVLDGKTIPAAARGLGPPGLCDLLDEALCLDPTRRPADGAVFLRRLEAVMEPAAD